MLEASPENWLEATAQAAGREVYLPAGRYLAGLVTHRLNLRGDGRDRTILANTRITCHGEEDYEPPFPDTASGRLELSRLSVRNTTIDIRFAAWLQFRDVEFHNCRIMLFSGWSVFFDHCHLVKTKVIVQDALKDRDPDRKLGNRGFSGKVWFDHCEIEAFRDWAIYLGFRSRLCGFTRSIFDTKEPGEHVAVIQHPDKASLDMAEHDFTGYKCRGNPGVGSVQRLAWRELTAAEYAA